MNNWAWLLPCWVWKYFFAQFPKQRVLVAGRTRFLIRLDEEFALVYDPQGQAMLPKSLSQINEYSRYRARPSFRTFEKPSPGSRPIWRKQVRANLGLTGWFRCWHAR